MAAERMLGHSLTSIPMYPSEKAGEKGGKEQSHLAWTEDSKEQRMCHTKPAASPTAPLLPSV